MRFRNFTATSMPEALRMVRHELGENAIIVSSQKIGNSNQVQVVAAVEHEPHPLPQIVEETQIEDQQDPYDVILTYLERHGMPAQLSSKILRASTLIATDNPVIALASALDRFFFFSDLNLKHTDKPFMFVGPPGTGKTITIAKIAARAVIAHETLHVLTTDTLKAGGVEQLGFLTKLMGLELKAVSSPVELCVNINHIKERNPNILIDTGAVNPYDPRELAELQNFIEAVDALPILVLPAGGDTGEMIDIVNAFVGIGVEKIIISRVDVTKRLGSILMAIDTHQIALTEISISPLIAEGLTPITPVSLAKLLLSDPSQLIHQAREIK